MNIYYTGYIVSLIASTLVSVFLCWWLDGEHPINPIGHVGAIGLSFSVFGWIMFVLHLAGVHGWALD